MLSPEEVEKVRAQQELVGWLRKYDAIRREKPVKGKAKKAKRRRRVDEIEQGIQAEARKYFGDQSLELRTGLKGGGIALIGQRDVRVLSRPDNAVKGRQSIEEMGFKQRLTHLDDDFSGYWVRGYSIGAQISRRRLLLAALGATAAGGVLMRYWFSGETRGMASEVHPYDRDMVIIYGPHNVAEDFGVSVRLLKALIQRHEDNGGNLKDLVVIDEYIPYMQGYWQELQGQYPELRNISAYELLTDKRYERYALKVYELAKYETALAYKQTFEQGKYVLPSFPLKDELWRFLFHKGIRTVPETNSFETWKILQTIPLEAGKGHGALARGDVDVFIDFMRKVEEGIAETTLIRDQELANSVSRMRESNNKLRALLARGFSHQHVDGVHQLQRYSYTAIVPEEFKDLPSWMTEAEKLIELRMQGVKVPADQYAARQLKGFMQHLIRSYQVNKEGDIKVAQQYADKVIQRMEVIKPIEQWVREIVEQSNQRDSRGQFILRAIARLGFLKAEDVGLPLVGGLLLRMPSRLSPSLYHLPGIAFFGPSPVSSSL